VDVTDEPGPGRVQRITLHHGFLAPTYSTVTSAAPPTSRPAAWSGGHLAVRLDRHAPRHPVCDLRQQRQTPVTLAEAKRILAERWTVPEEIRNGGVVAR
jgi:hypothetical protein